LINAPFSLLNQNRLTVPTKATHHRLPFLFLQHPKPLNNHVVSGGGDATRFLNFRIIVLVRRVSSLVPLFPSPSFGSGALACFLRRRYVRRCLDVILVFQVSAPRWWFGFG